MTQTDSRRPPVEVRGLAKSFGQGEMSIDALAVATLATSSAMVIAVVDGDDVALSGARVRAGRAREVLGRFEMPVHSGTDADAEANRRRGRRSAAPRTDPGR